MQRISFQLTGSWGIIGERQIMETKRKANQDCAIQPKYGFQLRKVETHDVSESQRRKVCDISLDSLTVLNVFLESVNAGAQSPLHFRGFAL
jgi:hypothetical protein